MPKTRNINAVIDEALADPARRANIERERVEAVRGMVIHSLGELRKTRQVTQVARPDAELRPVHHLRPRAFRRPVPLHPREYIQAHGGRLEVAAVFDDERFELKV